MKTFLGEQTPPRRSPFSPKSLFRSSNGLKELPEMRFEVLFNLIGKSTMAFLTGQSWRVLKSWYKGKGGWGGGGGWVRGRGGGKNKAFGAVSQKDLTKVKFRL